MKKTRWGTGNQQISRIYKPAFIFAVFAVAAACFGVNSKVTRQKSASDFLKGKTKDTIISSKGTIQLGRASEIVVEKFIDSPEPWSINCIVVSGPTIYFGTSPNGGIYSYDSINKIRKIYPQKSEEKKQESRPDTKSSEDTEKKESAAKSGTDSNQPDEGSVRIIKREQQLSNEHIFAMATDISGRLLAAISGKECRLMRLKGDEMDPIFEPNDAKYIFAIAVDKKGEIYLGTGPEGKIYRLDSSGKNPQVVYESKDKNILSLAISDEGILYAGSDERGIVYKIDVRTKKVSVLYDSDQPEVTAILIDTSGDIYAAGTSAQIVQTEEKFTSQIDLGGRPESRSERSGSSEMADSVRKLQIANTKKEGDDTSALRTSMAMRTARPAGTSFIYRINKEGFVTDKFSQSAVLFGLLQQDETLLAATGNKGQLYSIETEDEVQSVVYEDQQSSQITALAQAGEDVYLGMANPAKLVKLKKSLASEGTYNSDLIDAGQPAKWGKLQIDADIPAGCKILASSRSGNIKDANEPSFSDWTEPVEITEPVQLDCPVGRFSQYKLVLQSSDGKVSPVVREVAVASMVANLQPKIETLTIGRIEAAGKEGIFKIEYKASDENNDNLIYKIDFRKISTTVWIEMKDEIEASSYEWNGRTVEDGIYEIRVTASDERSNTPATKLSAVRISDPVIVDNTAPEITKCDDKVEGNIVTINLTAADKLSIIGKVQYTIDSSTDWRGVVPDDLVYDSTEEQFTIIAEKLKEGAHIISIKVSDDAGNTAYKSIEVKVAGKM